MKAIVKFFFINFIILTLSVSAYAVGRDSVVGYWPCDEGSGQVVVDVIGSANGTMMAGPAWQGQGTPHDQGWGAGKFGAGLVFNREKQWFIRVKNTDALGKIGALNTIFTVAFWVKTTDKDRKVRVVDKGSTNWVTKGWHCGLCCGGYPFLEVAQPPELAGFHAPAVLVADGEWHHVAFVFKMGDAVSIYVDGKFGKKADTYTVPDVGTDWDITFGAVGSLKEGKPPEGGQYVDGDVDDIAIFNRGLTEEEIKELATGPVLPTVTATETRNHLGTTWAEVKTRY